MIFELYRLKCIPYSCECPDLYDNITAADFMTINECPDFATNIITTDLVNCQEAVLQHSLTYETGCHSVVKNSAAVIFVATSGHLC